MNLTRLAILLSVMGLMPWHPAVRAAGIDETRVASTPHNDANEAAIRSVLGLGSPIASPPASSLRRTVAPSVERRSGAANRRVEPTTAGDAHWDAAALGLARPPRDRSVDVGATRATPPTREDAVRVANPIDEPSAQTDRIRVILGLEPLSGGRPLLAAMHPGLPGRLTGRSTVGPQPEVIVPIASLAGESAPTTLADVPAAEMDVTDHPDRTEWLSPIPDVAVASFEPADLLTPDGAPRPRKTRHEDPAPAITDASPKPRRIGTRVVASRVLPPEELETLDIALRDRLHGQFELPGRKLPMSDGVARLADDDPLVSLLQVLSADETGKDRPAPIVFVAATPESPQRAAVAADVFRRMADGIQRLGDDPPTRGTATIRADASSEQRNGVEEAANIPSAAKIDHVDFYIDAFIPLESKTAINSSTPVEKRLSEPLLPMNPLAWFGDDAIDLSASLTDHPLLLRPMPDVTKTDPARESILLQAVQPRIAEMGDIPRREMVLPRIAAIGSARTRGQRPPSTMIDIFDPNLGLARAAVRSPRTSPEPAIVAEPIASIASDPDRPHERLFMAMPRLPASAVAADETMPALLAHRPFETSVVEIVPAAPPIASAVSFDRAEFRPDPLHSERLAIADAKLEQMRGGFETDAGLKISFGIERAVYINGNLVTTTSLNVADLNRLTAGQAQAMGLDRSTLGIIQSGPNNTFNPGPIGAASVATVIQNSLNDQKIQGITAINATVNSLDLIRKTDMQQSIQSALAGSIRR